jgi:hypothetical protein
MTKSSASMGRDEVSSLDCFFAVLAGHGLSRHLDNHLKSDAQGWEGQFPTSRSIR